MVLRHQKAVSRKKRPAIQKGQGNTIFKDNVGLFFRANDLTERTRLAEVCLADRRILHARHLSFRAESQGSYSDQWSSVSVMMSWQYFARYNITTCRMRQLPIHTSNLVVSPV